MPYSREQKRAYDNARRRRLVGAGHCVRCQHPRGLSESVQFCQVCLEKHNKYMRSYNRRRKQS